MYSENQSCKYIYDKNKTKVDKIKNKKPWQHNVTKTSKYSDESLFSVDCLLLDMQPAFKCCHFKP